MKIYWVCLRSLNAASGSESSSIVNLLSTIVVNSLGKTWDKHIIIYLFNNIDCKIIDKKI